MKLAALPTLIAAGESLTLELKKSTAEKDRACPSLCALANGQGGQVVFGLTPTGKVVGQIVTDRTLDKLAQEFQGFEPPPKVFYRHGLIETWGRGTLKIAGLMQEAGLAAPTLRVNDDFVTMTFALPATMARSKNDGASEQTPGKTPNLILHQLATAPSTSIPELAQHLDKSDSAIERAIRKLRAEGKLRRIGPAKGGHWEVLE